ncbi:hypothetical protein ABPG72_004526 [Tetrahymena utriculariae]
MVQELRDFEILDKLGEGAYSSVFQVKRQSDGKIYALKRVMLGTLSEQEKQNALNEVRIIASIRHPNIVNFKQCFIDSHLNCLCIIMEYVDNGDLLSHINKHIKNGTYFQEEEIWNVLIQVIKGLQSLHQLNIYHRDLKSANVFMNKDGSIKLGDFNVSKICKQGLLYTQTGTPYYASPEVWRDLPYDSKADIWSIGCVIYEMCALKPPFRAENMPSLFKKVVKGQYQKIPSFYSQQLSQIIRSMLQVSPHLRPSCKKILEDEIVQKHMNEKHLEEPDEQERSILINTIKFPQAFKNKYAKIDFPKPNYHPIKIRKRISSNTRLMTTFDQSESILQCTNKSMIEEPSHKMLTENSTHQPPSSQRHHSQRQILNEASILSMAGIENTTNNSNRQQNINKKNSSSLLQSDKIEQQEGISQNKKDYINVNQHVNYIQQIDKISNIELSDQLLVSSEAKKKTNASQQNIQGQNQHNIIQGNIQNEDLFSEYQSKALIIDNSKSVSLADGERKIQKQSISTNESRRKSIHARQSSSLSSQVQPKNYSQINKQKQLYKILKQPTNAIKQIQKQSPIINNQNIQINQHIINSYNNSLLLNQPINDQQHQQKCIKNESISSALRESLIALEKDIAKSTKAQRASIQQNDSKEINHAKGEQNLRENEKIITGSYSRSHKNSCHVTTDGVQKNENSIKNGQLESSIGQQNKMQSYKDRNIIPEKENQNDIQYISERQTTSNTTKNTKQNSKLNYEKSKSREINQNRQSTHLQAIQNSQMNQHRIPTLYELDKSPIAYNEGRKKSKSIFERNATIVTVPDQYMNLEYQFQKDKMIESSSRQQIIDHGDNTQNILIKKRIKYSGETPEKIIILPIINPVKNTKGDRSISVQRKYSPIYSQNNNRENFLNRNGQTFQENEVKRKIIFYESEQKIQDQSQMHSNQNNLYINSNKLNYYHNKVSYQQSPLTQDKYNMQLDMETIGNYKRIHSNSVKPAHKNSLSPQNYRINQQKLI